jgi:hypothetical protein
MEISLFIRTFQYISDKDVILVDEQDDWYEYEIKLASLKKEQKFQLDVDYIQQILAKYKVSEYYFWPTFTECVHADHCNDCYSY